MFLLCLYWVLCDLMDCELFYWYLQEPLILWTQVWLSKRMTLIGFAVVNTDSHSFVTGFTSSYVYRPEVIPHSCKPSLKLSSLLCDLNSRAKPASLTSLPGWVTCLNVPMKHLGSTEGQRKFHQYSSVRRAQWFPSIFLEYWCFSFWVEKKNGERVKGCT